MLGGVELRRCGLDRHQCQGVPPTTAAGRCAASAHGFPEASDKFPYFVWEYGRNTDIEGEILYITRVCILNSGYSVYLLRVLFRIRVFVFRISQRFNSPPRASRFKPQGLRRTRKHARVDTLRDTFFASRPAGAVACSGCMTHRARAKLCIYICELSLLCNALYAKCPCYSMLYMQSVW